MVLKKNTRMQSDGDKKSRKTRKAGSPKVEVKPEVIRPATENQIKSETEHPTSEIKPMEVHHHPNVEKKNFKEYILEGLMIFIAVMMGFFAESLREHIADREKETQYVISMIEDAKTDTLNFQHAITANEKRGLFLDSLQEQCFNFNGGQHEVSEIYRFFRHGLAHPDFVLPTERTISQLNTGGMRLISKKSVADSIIAYADYGKKLVDQQAYYEMYQNKSMDGAFGILNFKYFGVGTKKTKPDYSQAQLLDNNVKGIVDIGSHIALYDGVVSFYIVRLKEGKQHAIGLINTLKKEYGLGDE